MFTILEIKTGKLKKIVMEFSCGTGSQGSGIVTAASQVAGVAWVQSLTWGLPRAASVAKKKKKEKVIYSF